MCTVTHKLCLAIANFVGLFEWYSQMKSAESGGTINQRLIVDSICLIRYNVHILKDPQNGSISSPQNGY